MRQLLFRPQPRLPSLVATVHRWRIIAALWFANRTDTCDSLEGANPKVSSLRQFAEFLLGARLVRPNVAPYFARWVRRFLSRPASDEPLLDRVRGFLLAVVILARSRGRLARTVANP